MSAPESDRERLGVLVLQRRRALGMSISRAARGARIDRATWTGLERGTRRTETYNYNPIEQVLGWAAGSVDAILAGGEPTPVEDLQELRAPASAAEAGMAKVREVLEFKGISDSMRIYTIRGILEDYLQEVATTKRGKPRSGDSP